MNFKKERARDSSHSPRSPRHIIHCYENGGKIVSFKRDPPPLPFMSYKSYPYRTHSLVIITVCLVLRFFFSSYSRCIARWLFVLFRHLGSVFFSMTNAIFASTVDFLSKWGEAHRPSCGHCQFIDIGCCWFHCSLSLPHTYTHTHVELVISFFNGSSIPIHTPTTIIRQLTL